MIARFLLLSLTISIFSNALLNAQTLKPRKIQRLMQDSPVLNEQFTGFSLYDLDNRKHVMGINEEKYFIPASNTKLFTFYAGMKTLRDSVLGLKYAIRGDSLIFWGTGDPTFLHPDYPEQEIAAFLRNSGKKLFWASGLYKGRFYGTGWPYGDYNAYYQAEISELPVFGNLIRLSSENGKLKAVPGIENDGPLVLMTDSISRGGFSVRRELQENLFHRPNANPEENYEQSIPFKTDDLTMNYLLTKNFANYYGRTNMSLPSDVKTLYSVKSDTLYKHLLQPSDNFIAEQLLLNIAAEKGLVMSADSVIRYVSRNYLTDLPDRPRWADGSGLSKHNMFTPRSVVKLCEKIYDERGDQDRLFDLLPQGGKTGTIRNLYKSTDEPFVFAKTGSLNGVSSLSGYLVTKKGKNLIFSFMNNNFVRPASEIRAEMERIMTFIYQNY